MPQNVSLSNADFIKTVASWLFVSAGNSKQPCNAQGNSSRWQQSALMTYEEIERKRIPEKHNMELAAFRLTGAYVVIDLDYLSKESAIQSGDFTYELPFPVEEAYAEWSQTLLEDGSHKGLHIYCKVDASTLKTITYSKDVRESTLCLLSGADAKAEVFTSLNQKARVVVFTGNAIPNLKLVYNENNLPVSTTESSPRMEYTQLSCFFSDDTILRFMTLQTRRLYLTGDVTADIALKDTSPSGIIYTLVVRFTRYTQDFEQISRLISDSHTYKNTSWGNPSLPDGSGKYFPKGKWNSKDYHSEDPSAKTIGEHLFHSAYKYCMLKGLFYQGVSDAPYESNAPANVENPASAVEITALANYLYTKVCEFHSKYFSKLVFSKKNLVKREDDTPYIDFYKMAEFMSKVFFDVYTLEEPYFNLSDITRTSSELVKINPYMLVSFAKQIYSYDFITKTYKLRTGAELDSDMYSLLHELFPTIKHTILNQFVNSWSKLALAKSSVRTSKREVLGHGELSLDKWVNLDSPNASNTSLRVLNGILNLNNNTLVAPTPEFFSTTATPIIIDPAKDFLSPSKPVRWLRYLEEEFGKDDESKEALQRFLGYCLHPANPEGKGLFMLGETKSGKSTILYILNKIFPNRVKQLSLTAMKERFAFSGLSRLRVFGCSEMGNVTLQDMSVIAPKLKALTSPVDTVEEESKGVDGVQVTPACKVVLAGNLMPQFPNEGNAISERFIYINFPVSFAGKEDSSFIPDIDAQIKDIFLWILEGYHKWYHDFYELGLPSGLLQPSSGLSTKTSLIEMATPSYVSFMTECCRIHPELPATDAKIDHSKWIFTDQLYSFYKIYCESAGLHALARKRFTNRLTHEYLPAKYGTADTTVFYRQIKPSQYAFYVSYVGVDAPEDLSQ